MQHTLKNIVNLDRDRVGAGLRASAETGKDFRQEDPLPDPR